MHADANKDHSVTGAHGSDEDSWVGRKFDEEVKPWDDGNHAQVGAGNLAKVVVVL